MLLCDSNRLNIVSAEASTPISKPYYWNRTPIVGFLLFIHQQKMKKKTKTPEEIAENERIKAINKATRNLITKVKNSCKELGLRPTELHLDFIRNNPQCELPKKELGRDETISCYEQGINKFKEECYIPFK